MRRAVGGRGVVGVGQVVAAVRQVERQFVRGRPTAPGGARAGAPGLLDIDHDFAKQAGRFAGDRLVALRDDVGRSRVPHHGSVDRDDAGVVGEDHRQLAPGRVRLDPLRRPRQGAGQPPQRPPVHAETALPVAEKECHAAIKAGKRRRFNPVLAHRCACSGCSAPLYCMR